MKKLFHRRKTSAPSSTEQTSPQSQRPNNVNANPSFRTSRYESTAPADLPQTGQFPLKGNNSSVSFQGRRSETYTRGHGTGPPEPSPRPSSSSPYYGSLPAPRVTSATHGNAPSGNGPPEGLPDYGGARSYQERHIAPNDPPIHDFSNLNLHSSNRDDQEDFPLRQDHGSNTAATNSRDPHHDPTGYRHRPHDGSGSRGIRMVDGAYTSQSEDRGYGYGNTVSTPGRDQERHGYRHQNYSHSGTKPSHHVSGKGREDEGTVRRTTSIPRKEVSKVADTSNAGHQPQLDSSFVTDRTLNNPETSSRTQDQNPDDHGLRPQQRSQPNARTRGVPPAFSPDTHPSAQEIVDRARGNTYDTEVVEKVAPAVVHERVHQEIHHVREELITREIHEHEVHHRILPVIDVEVLPPRHFLPVEGGGLVEISGKEVPGRGNNWVIAETASKIPSDQVAPQGSRTFTARRFPGTQGDAVQYTTTEGFPRTEQTWVHPPELETGGRNTGQTWPMEFGSETTGRVDRDQKPSKSPRSKRSRKSIDAQSSAMQQARA